MVVVGALGLFVLIFLSLIGSFECSFLSYYFSNGFNNVLLYLSFFNKVSQLHFSYIFIDHISLIPGFAIS